MNRTDQTLLEQMRITQLEIESRKTLFNISYEDVEILNNVKPLVEQEIDEVVKLFYELQTDIPEIALLIGDADTLGRLRNAQRKYIIDLFSGFYDIEYVNNRLRIGMVHKRIGVEPKLYLAAVQQLKKLLMDMLQNILENQPEQLLQAQSALEKLFMFDVSLVFDTYIRSLISEIETSKEKSEDYAIELEQKVKERTLQLEILSRTDALTGLLNVRHLNEILTQTLRAAQRRLEPVTVAYLDINNFKKINDEEGHQRGDEILRTVANAINRISREEDQCFRYGGDEFCIVLPKCTEKQAKQLYSRRLMDEIQLHEADLTLSVGYMQAGPDDYPSAEEIIHCADQHMYENKHDFKENHQEETQPEQDQEETK
ncbi:GGDEF domain-containing protein [Thiomicrorhabdus sediminis]|uniref:Diguanylate cyclase DosC n=1 Tax=Thiomicrorhabdus sediminis TaxID=2580412 RepID=A0A4P9K318_9GAMM|nr:GGDEF domain-containing protein [Thiomicrorhabdus sediminis]QCU89254.1 GGDEF domain-containing protein [Thiomicrorhabdus sediminis]